MSKDSLRRLPDHVTATLLRALMTLPAPRHKRLVLQRAPEPRAPWYDTTNDYDVLWRDQKVGRIDLDPRPYPEEAHVPWCWFLDDEPRKRMASGRTATREQAMIAFRESFETVPDNTVAKSSTSR